MTMLNSLQKDIQVKLAESEEEFNKIYCVRKEVFGAEQSYTESCLQLNRMPNEQYILCYNKYFPIGTITTNISERYGDLDIDKYFDLSPYYAQHGKIAFWSRAAVLRVHRRSFANILMHIFMYKLFYAYRVQYIAVDCRIDNSISISFLPKLGYQRIGECIKGEIGPVIIWGAPLADCMANVSSYVEQKGMKYLLEPSFLSIQESSFSKEMSA
ncbi:hypothetical protein [Desulfovibrio inopinatus]|uniref:hypothetical protein n=1 Tax=Desulfovibrio inopinatus TaxID=102109 RepID=UPI00047FE0C0|nr:hypothetical protein [Desulfovibrio inopinatus]